MIDDLCAAKLDWYWRKETHKKKRGNKISNRKSRKVAQSKRRKEKWKCCSGCNNITEPLVKCLPALQGCCVLHRH